MPRRHAGPRRGRVQRASRVTERLAQPLPSDLGQLAEPALDHDRVAPKLRAVAGTEIRELTERHFARRTDDVEFEAGLRRAPQINEAVTALRTGAAQPR